MLQTSQENTEDRKISEKELDAVYVYLNMYMDSMEVEEKLFWLEILKKIDEEFYDDTNIGPDKLQNLQGIERDS